MMIRTLVLLTVLLSACTSVSFDSDLPKSSKSITAFTPDMLGKYLLTDSVVGTKNELMYNALYFQDRPGQDSFCLIAVDLSIEKKNDL